MKAVAFGNGLNPYQHHGFTIHEYAHVSFVPSLLSHAKKEAGEVHIKFWFHVARFDRPIWLQNRTTSWVCLEEKLHSDLEEPDHPSFEEDAHH